jgi:hypothetical protein
MLRANTDVGVSNVNLNIFIVAPCILITLKFLSPTNAPLYYTSKMLKYTVKISHNSVTKLTAHTTHHSLVSPKNKYVYIPFAYLRFGFLTSRNAEKHFNDVLYRLILHSITIF